jgi:hypothetical protein
VVAGRSTRSLDIMEATASRIPRAQLIAPAVALTGTAIASYAFVVWFPVAVLYTPVMIFPVLIALACITVEIIAVPQAISTLIRVPSLRTRGNVISVVVGVAVILTYGLFFVASTG